MSGAGQQADGEAPATGSFRDVLAGLAPAALVLVFATVCGTFDAPIHGWRVVAGHALIAGLALAGCRSGLDPLGLGRWGRWLPAALLAWAVASAWRSPVPRAAFEPLLVALPLLVCVPAVACAWSTERRRHIGGMALASCILGVAAWALAAAALEGGRPALPVGHHNLLALWLVMLVPLVLVPRRLAGAPRWVGWGALVVAPVAVIATRSLGGALALAMVAMITSLRAAGTRMGRRVAGGVGAVVLALAVPRLIAVVSGTDPSALARQGYLLAAGRGVSVRPIIGWGPGAAAWTLPEWMRPVPGIHPAGEVVADPHSLPVLVAYELGLIGLALLVALSWVFLRRRPTHQPFFGRAAALGLAAFGVAAIFSRPAAATAVWAALAVVAGARLASAAPAVPPAAAWQRRSACAIIVLCTLSLAVLDGARLAYGRAVVAGSDDLARPWLERAIRLDPWHPLYRARLAVLDRDSDAAFAAALDARGVAALWLAAGQHTGPQRLEALRRACRLDPLAPMAWLQLALVEPVPAVATEQGARALLTEPRLLAAKGWVAHPGLRRAAVDAAVGTAGVDPGWRETLAERASPSLPGAGGATALALYADRDPATAISLHVFRRPPWPWRLAAAELDLDAAASIDLSPAAALVSTHAEIFDPAFCGR